MPAVVSRAVEGSLARSPSHCPRSTSSGRRNSVSLSAALGSSSSAAPGSSMPVR